MKITNKGCAMIFAVCSLLQLFSAVVVRLTQGPGSTFAILACNGFLFLALSVIFRVKIKEEENTDKTENKKELQEEEK